MYGFLIGLKKFTYTRVVTDGRLKYTCDRSHLRTLVPIVKVKLHLNQLIAIFAYGLIDYNSVTCDVARKVSVS